MVYTQGFLFLLHVLDYLVLTELQSIQYFMSYSKLFTLASGPLKTLPITPLPSLRFCSLIFSVLSLNELHFPRYHPLSFASSYHLCNNFLQARLLPRSETASPILPEQSPLSRRLFGKQNKTKPTNKKFHTQQTPGTNLYSAGNYETERFKSVLFIQVVVTVLQEKS